MFKSQNFCHIASNNRNQVKVGVFVYRTTDSLATVLVSGYFNDRIIDINLHDLIIHEKVDSADATKVERNLLCVTERTLENVGTVAIKSKWEGDIEQAIADLQTYVDTHFVKLDGTSVMTGPLKFSAGSMRGAVAPYLNGVSFWKMDSQGNITNIANLTDSQFLPVTTDSIDIGRTANAWKDAYVARVITSVINNGFDIAVPVTNSADTLALKSEVDLAANSGRMITDQGLWYAKMYAATVAPAAEDGTNYADFSQTDGQGNPIIVIYERQSGAWVQSETITPPAEYDGYVPITSKIWDIPEQAGQQGGRILWNHQSKEFTPYPQIISFENINVTGESTVDIPVNPVAGQIVNKQYVDNALVNHGTGRNVGDVFFTMRNDNNLNGAVDCNGATYNTTDFTGAQSIGQLLAAGKVPYVSLSQYATLLSTQGSVGVFGWDGGNTTEFKVPSLNDIFVETGTAAQIGDYLPAGLPNMTAKVQFTGDTNAVAGGGAAYATADSRNHDIGAGTAVYSPSSVLIDASEQNAIYGNSDTVQPNTVRYRAMVQLATSASDEALETCTAVTAQVAANTAAIAGADYVVESQLPTAQNNYTWYRKYKSGWVEQGGIYTGASDNYIVNLPVAMADSNYCISGISDNNSGVSGSFTMIDGGSQTTTGFMIVVNFSGPVPANKKIRWQVSGVAAS